MLKKTFFPLLLILFLSNISYSQESWVNFTIADGLASDTVFSVAMDSEGNKWFGTKGGVSKFDGTNWTNYTTSDGLAANAACPIVIDSEGNKWFMFGKYSGGVGVSKFDGTNWTTYNTSNSGLAHNAIMATAIDLEGNKWFGSDFGGLSKFDGTNWTNYTTSDGLADNRVWSIAIDSEDNKWFGTVEGVSKFDGTNWTTYTTSDGLADTLVNSISIDSEGNKWFGFNGRFEREGKGVSKFDGTNWTTYTTADGLANNKVFSIAIDSYGNKWFGTEGGVSALGNPVTIPVELVSFNYMYKTDNEVELIWATASETNNYGFEIERSIDGINFEKIGFVNGSGNSFSLKEYSFTDKDLSNGTYYYRLKQIDFDGSYSYTDILTVELSIPEKFILFQNYPNPFNPETIIKYQLPEQTNVTLKIYNQLGQEVMTLIDENKESGNYQVKWDGRNNQG